MYCILNYKRDLTRRLVSIKLIDSPVIIKEKDGIINEDIRYVVRAKIGSSIRGRIKMLTKKVADRVTIVTKEGVLYSVMINCTDKEEEKELFWLRDCCGYKITTESFNNITIK